MSKKNDKKGVSLKTIHILLVLGAVILSGLMLYSTFSLSASYKDLTESSEQTIELRKAALELKDASDYMTERVQRFTVSGNKQLLQEYYDEAFSTQRREEAIKKLSSNEENSAALKKLQEAMDASQHLMNREYYAIRLVVEAKGIEESPIPLDDVVLSDRDKSLSAQEKMHRAQDIVTDNEYYSQKHLIHDDMHASLDELEKHSEENNQKSLESLRKKLTFVSIAVILGTIAIFALVWLASHLGINPILNAVERIKSNNRIPEAGTTEFRYLVRAYNQMYEMYRESIRSLDFKASHDELTGVFNRSGYESLLSSIELESTYMLLFDIDNFKTINDTYGHKTGDSLLQRFVEVLKNNFRPDDFICRLGGDEFVVLMQRTPKSQEKLIARKIETINEELENGNDDIPGSSISVGIAHGSDVYELEELFKKTDVAMYESKQRGKKTYTFYSTKQSTEDNA